jgi:hypothetical protein
MITTTTAPINFELEPSYIRLCVKLFISINLSGLVIVTCLTSNEQFILAISGREQVTFDEIIMMFAMY